MREALGTLPARSLGIDAFWEHAGAARAHRILPDGCMDFLFDLETGTSRVIGPMSVARLVSTPERARVFGVRFRPGIAPRLLGETAASFLDDSAELSLFRGGHFAALGAELSEARTFDARRAVVTRALSEPGARIRPFDSRVRRAVELMEAAGGRGTLRNVASELGMGERQLERLFVENVGHGPKLFARIVRMHHVIGLASRARLRQAELAAYAGFSDEPHLLRELKALTGVTLRTLALERHVGFVQVVPALRA
jgi:AraC-like DNA-binding protein